MKRSITLALIAAMVFAPGVQPWTASAADSTLQQDSKRQISGVVTDKIGEPIVGASVMIPKSTVGIMTDVDGRYFLEVPSRTATIEVSCIGYKTQTITLGTSDRYNISLADDTEMLEETVVVGYGVQKKVNMTGSVSAVDFQTVAAKSRPITNAAQALTNVTPGLQVMQSSGQPNNESFGMTIRGTGTLNSSSPLVLVDGMEQSISMVNPADIASVSILKDAASCAIYGNRGANGVILITTKSGSNDGSITVNLDASLAYSEPFKIIHTVSDYARYMELFNESQTNIGNSPQFAQSIIDTWREAAKDPDGLSASGYPNYVAYPNTDWWSEIYNKSLQQTYNVSISGKEKKSGYTMSFGYVDNPGIIDNSGYNRYQGRINLYSDVTKWLRVGARIWGNVTNQDVLSLDLGGLTTTKMLACTYPYYDGKYGAPENSADDPQSHNPLWDFASSTGHDKRTQLYTDWYAQIKFLKHFTYSFDYYYNDLRREKKTVDTAIGKYSFSQGAFTTGAADPATLYTYMYYTRDNTYKLNHLLNYSQSFGRHDISVMLGYEQQHYEYRESDMSKLGLTDANVNDFNAAVTPYSTKGYGTEWTSQSYFGRVNYAFAGKYLFEANFRYDGSSRFAPSCRWGFFPSASAAWRVSEEPFMKSITALSDLKLRVSYGELGNNAIGNYDWQSIYSSANYASGSDLQSGIAITSIANNALRWESTAVANIGLDYAFLNDRLTGTVDVYNKLTSGILYTPDMFMAMGNASAPKQNIAEVTNRGIELELGWRDDIGDLSYSIKGNFSYNKNWVSKYKGKLNDDKSNIGDVSTGSTTRVLEGHMINEWYLPNVYKGTGNGYAADGINGGPIDGMIRTETDMEWLLAMQENGYSFQPTNKVGQNTLWYGEYIYADTNNDGVYGNAGDSEFQNISTTPKYNFGLEASLNWKNLDFAMSWGGSAGFAIYYYSTGRNASTTIYGYAIPEKIANDHYFYDPSNPSDPRTNLTSKNPRLAYNSSAPSSASSSLHLEKGNFLKLRNLQIGYTLPAKLSQKFMVQRLRFYLSGENLFAITGFSGQDPEQRATVAYSTMRQYSAGVNITF